MKRDKFDELWNHVVLSIFDDMNVDGTLTLKRNAKKRVYSQYQKEKTFVKTNYMIAEDKHLDRHKIASCVLYAIMKVYPVQINMRAIWKKHKEKGEFNREYQLLNETTTNFLDYPYVTRQMAAKLGFMGFLAICHFGRYLAYLCLFWHRFPLKSSTTVVKAPILLCS